MGGGVGWSVVVILDVEVTVVAPAVCVCVTPGPFWGSVTISVEVVWCLWLEEVVVSEDSAGHTAAIIPPISTASSSEFGSAVTPWHARMTLCATASRACSHTPEQPSLKSDTRHDGIWL
jgi:hypothetical protein